jgi:hypothetical protein
MCEMLPISALAEKAGISAAQLRIWERRYGWPKPQRLGNGYRAYPEWMVADVRRAMDLINLGRTTIRDLIVDGLPQWPTTYVEKPAPRKLDLSSVPEPEGFDAKAFRAHLVEAILSRNFGRVRELTTESVFLKPHERKSACEDVVAAAKQQGLL